MVLPGSFDQRDKLLIIHADDVGMCHSENMATFLGFQNGLVSSCSLMMPCPWVLEAVEFFRSNPDYDHGIHSTLTSEWKHYRWGPVSSKNEVPTLIDEEDYLYRDAKDAAKASQKDTETELRAQVKRAFELGLHPSHLDSHMGTVFFRPDFLETYMRIALDNGLIPMLIKPVKEVLERAKEIGMDISQDTVRKVLESGIVLDNLIDSSLGSDLQERIKWFRSMLTSIEQGTVTQLIVHLGLPEEEIKAIMPSYMERYLDYQLVTSKETLKIIKELGFTLVSWKDLKGGRV
ncbi:MAG: polysaccharide deacetylase family protein [Thermoproteota archaeon]